MPSAEDDQYIKFTFTQSYMKMTIDEDTASCGWRVVAHANPFCVSLYEVNHCINALLLNSILKIDQETVDKFGKELPKPPEFLVTIQAMDNPTETILKVPVILDEVDTKESKIFIVRTFEEGTFFLNYNIELPLYHYNQGHTQEELIG